jgi:hypothetical protein
MPQIPGSDSLFEAADRPAGPLFRPVAGVAVLRVRRPVDSDPTAVSERLVTAIDARGQQWWIPATSVWLDAEQAETPEHPRPHCLGIGRSPTAAILSGLRAVASGQPVTQAMDEYVLAELRQLIRELAALGLEPLVIDLGTPYLRQVGASRYSVHLANLV